ncbi:hypothetical protein [Shouchella lonarensis]|uniref:Uncharacterized protein n=1 Tax=Shouchella lonarensis TaxID=1464122 RepID=A0A1G6IJ81_9BACI|nr:hypothetical protein [Shouchella lonarensis]SDC06558.1 hypothetical protein SAMN05421737_10583 [Shouchella lonarensis]
MKQKLSKLISATVAATLIATGIGSTLATSKASAATQGTVSQPSSTFTMSTNFEQLKNGHSVDRVEQQGVKGWIAKQAIQLLASAIRNGGKEVSKLVGYLDKGAAKAFNKNSGKIANELDKIAKIPDVTANMVKDKLYTFLTKQLKMKGGDAMQIADAVKAVVNWLIF